MASSDGAARILRSALPPGPGAASPGEAYTGSRRHAQRWEYSTHSTAGFVELIHGSFGAVSWDARVREAAGKEFYKALANVSGVAKVPGGGHPHNWLLAGEGRGARLGVRKGQALPARCARSQALPARCSFGLFQ